MYSKMYTCILYILETIYLNKLCIQDFVETRYTLYNSVTYITQYSIHILEFCLREIDDPTVQFHIPQT